jgi:glutathione synthase/RimK-type ligase-like ATP-grasp enzyme
VQIIGKKEISSLNKLEEKTIAQDFIDSSRGICGIVNGTHDLRLVFINEELIYCYIRQPQNGSLLANISQGGQMTIVEPREVPKNILLLAKDVQKVFRQYPIKIYTIDLILDKKQRPWIVELNTMPGMYFCDDQKKWMDKFYLELIKTFKKII